MLNQAGDLTGKVILTCSLPMNEDNTALVVAHTNSGAEELARMLPKSHIVSAFNTIPSEVLFDVYESRQKSPRPSLIYCGDEISAKTIAAALIRDTGFDPPRRRPFANRPLHRILRPPRCPARVRGNQGAGIGVSIRMASEIDADFNYAPLRGPVLVYSMHFGLHTANNASRWLLFAAR